MADRFAELEKWVKQYSRARPDSTTTAPLFREMLLVLKAQDARIAELECRCRSAGNTGKVSAVTCVCGHSEEQHIWAPASCAICECTEFTPKE